MVCKHICVYVLYYLCTKIDVVSFLSLTLSGHPKGWRIVCVAVFKYPPKEAFTFWLQGIQKLFIQDMCLRKKRLLPQYFFQSNKTKRKLWLLMFRNLLTTNKKSLRWKVRRTYVCGVIWWRAASVIQLVDQLKGQDSLSSWEFIYLCVVYNGPKA